MGYHDQRWRLVCYDIRDPGRWRLVHRIVKGFGRRIQLSVYRCRLDDKETEQLRWELSRVMAPEDDLLIVDLCPSCANRVVARNDVNSWKVDPPRFRIVGLRRDHAPDVGEGGAQAKGEKSCNTRGSEDDG